MKNLLLSAIAAFSLIAPSAALANNAIHTIPAQSASINVCGMPNSANFQGVVFGQVSYNLALQNDTNNYQLQPGDQITLTGDNLVITHNLDSLDQVCKDALADENVDVNVNISLGADPQSALWSLSDTVLNDTTHVVSSLTGSATTTVTLDSVTLTYNGPVSSFLDASPTLTVNGQIETTIPSDIPVTTSIFNMP